MGYSLFSSEEVVELINLSKSYKRFFEEYQSFKSSKHKNNNDQKVNILTKITVNYLKTLNHILISYQESFLGLILFKIPGLEYSDPQKKITSLSDLQYELYKLEILKRNILPLKEISWIDKNLFINSLVNLENNIRKVEKQILKLEHKMLDSQEVALSDWKETERIFILENIFTS